jgi:hypothetical protein
MSDPAFGIDFPRARVFWRVERPLNELSASSALHAASSRLRKSHASVEPQAGRAALSFGWTLRAGRSWLACVWGGTVEVTEKDNVLVTTVGASPVPLILFAGAGALAVGAGGLGRLWLVGVPAFLLSANYLFVHFGLWRVAEAVARATPAARAA